MKKIDKVMLYCVGVIFKLASIPSILAFPMLALSM